MMGKIFSFIIFLAIVALILSLIKFGEKSFFLTRSENLQETQNTLENLQNRQFNNPKFEVLATGLEVPWAVAFLPTIGEENPRKIILVTERKGVVKIINDAGKLKPSPIAKINVKATGEGGLLGITIHPNFTKNRYIYLYYTYSANGGNTLNRVSRFVFSDDKLIDEKVVVDKIPGNLFHNGGRIKFGPDNYLYITTGDAQNPSFAQSKNSLAGKILRVTEDGTPAPGNAFGTSIFSLGHRNPQGLAWDRNGNLWETEHGPSGTPPDCCQDELNLIVSGKNYGWPEVTGDSNRTGFINPKLISGTSVTWAPSGATINDNFIYFGGLKGQTLYRVNLEDLQFKEFFKLQFGRIRDVITGPDNYIYVTTSNRDGRGNPQPDDDKIIRIDPKQL